MWPAYQGDWWVCGRIPAECVHGMRFGPVLGESLLAYAQHWVAHGENWALVLD
jgi:hypothetical protein